MVEKAKAPQNPCARHIGNIRRVITAVRQASGSEDALQRIKEILPSHEVVPRRMEKIIEDVISQYFPKPRF